MDTGQSTNYALVLLSIIILFNNIKGNVNKGPLHGKMTIPNSQRSDQVWNGTLDSLM